MSLEDARRVVPNRKAEEEESLLISFLIYLRSTLYILSLLSSFYNLYVLHILPLSLSAPARTLGALSIPRLQGALFSLERSPASQANKDGVEP